MTPLTASRRHPRYFQDPAGYPVYLCAADGSDLLHRADLDLRTGLGRFAAGDLNCAAVTLDAQDRDPAVRINPFKRSKGSGRTRNGHRLFDLTAFNSAYWERLSALVKHARTHHLFVLIRLSDTVLSTEDESWNDSAWNPSNSVQGSEGDGAEGDYKATGTFVAERRQAFLEAALDATGSFHNVFYQLSDAPQVSADRVLEQARFIGEQTDAPLLLSARHTSLGGAEAAGYVADAPADFGNRWGEEMQIVPAAGRSVLLLRGNDPAIVSGPAAIRRAAWTAFVSGAQWLQPLPPLQPEEEAASRQLDMLLHAAGCIRRFLRERRVRYWKLRLAPDLADGVPCLAELERYLAFLPQGGSLSLDLTAAEGVFTVGWWNVEEEILNTQGTLFAGGRSTLTAPDDGPWTLDLFKRIR